MPVKVSSIQIILLTRLEQEQEKGNIKLKEVK